MMVSKITITFAIASNHASGPVIVSAITILVVQYLPILARTLRTRMSFEANRSVVRP
jgi:hypothetical protein